MEREYGPGLLPVAQLNNNPNALWKQVILLSCHTSIDHETDLWASHFNQDSAHLSVFVFIGSRS